MYYALIRLSDEHKLYIGRKDSQAIRLLVPGVVIGYSRQSCAIAEQRARDHCKRWKATLHRIAIKELVDTWDEPRERRSVVDLRLPLPNIWKGVTYEGRI